MARVRLLSNEEATAETRELFERIEKNGAKVLNLYRTVGHSPPAAGAFIKLGSLLLNRAKLAPRFRELAILRIATIAKSEYEWTQHVPIAREAGLSEDQIDAIGDWEESAVFDAEERAVLRYTDEVASTVAVGESTFDGLREFLDEQEIVELTLSIGYWSMVARVLVALSVDIDVESVGSAADLLGKGK